MNLSVALGPLGLLALACASCSEPTTNYGPPEGLNTTHLPSAPTSTPGSGTPDSGMTTPDEDTGTTGGDDAAPPPAGDGGACAVSWSKTIYPALSGRWTCSGASCHLAGAPAPKIDNNDATGTYDAFKAFTAAQGAPNGLPYILPGNTNPAASSFLCSVDPTNNCPPLMPSGASAASTPVTATDIQNITAWVTCGAPNN